MEDDLLWKKTFKIKNRNISATTDRILSTFETWAYGTKQMLWKLEIKMTFHRRRPPMEEDLKN